VLNVKGKVKLSKVTRKRISSFGEDADGRLLVTDLAAGVIYRVKMRGPRP
jgi:glucose/arabinose dehydrogenase